VASPGQVQNIADVLAPEPDDYFILKPKHSGFYESALGILLDHLNARQLILTRGTADERCRANLKIAAEITRYFLRAGARALPMVAPSHVSPGIPRWHVRCSAELAMARVTSLRARDSERERVSPWSLGGLGIIELGKRVWSEANEDEIFDRAAALSYYFVFAIFPALLFLTSLLGMLPNPDLMNSIMAYVAQAMPADAASIVERTLSEVVGGARGSLLSIGALAALWAASGGLSAMMTALSVTYDVQDSRSWWKRKMIALGLTFALAIVLLSAAALMVFGGSIGRFLGNTVGMGDVAVLVWSIVQWPLGVVFLVFGIALLYYAAPAVEHRKWYWITPGSLVATLGWIAMSLGLRFYLSHFSNYTATYGSITGVMLLMLWLYLTGLVLLVGAEVNAEIEHAAAARGAVTAKAKGEKAPGVPGEPAQERDLDRAV